ncbi:unnamed protein product, partial [Discosporangium mesarthrocarpum]
MLLADLANTLPLQGGGEGGEAAAEGRRGRDSVTEGSSFSGDSNSGSFDDLLASTAPGEGPMGELPSGGFDQRESLPVADDFTSSALGRSGGDETAQKNPQAALQDLDLLPAIWGGGGAPKDNQSLENGEPSGWGESPGARGDEARSAGNDGRGVGVAGGRGGKR